MTTIKDRIKPFLEGKTPELILGIVADIIAENAETKKEKLLHDMDNCSSAEEVVGLIKSL